MKHKLLSILLTVSMLLTLLPTAALAEEPTLAAHTNHCVCGATHTSIGDHTTENVITGWTPVTNTLPTTSGYYYLTQNVSTGSGEWRIENNQNIVLCLNGYTLTANNGRSSGTDTILVFSTLTITDCNGSGNNNGKITGTNENDTANKKAIQVPEGGTLNLYAGSITGINAGSGSGGGVHNRGTFNMYGGSITNNKAAKGGGVLNWGGPNHSATFNMYGGTIRGNQSKTDFSDGNDIYNELDQGHKPAVMNACGGTVGGTVRNYQDSTIQTPEGYTGTNFNGAVTNGNQGKISGGNFSGEVTNDSGGNVSGGSFSNTVTNNGTVTGGSFSGTVNNSGTVSNGSFTGAVTNSEGGQLTGGVFYNLTPDPTDTDGQDYYTLNFKWNRSDTDDANYYTIHILNKNTVVPMPNSPAYPDGLVLKDNDHRWSTSRTGTDDGAHYSTGTQTFNDLFHPTNDQAVVANLYAQWEILTTVDVPYNLKVQQSGNVTPPANFAALMLMYEDGQEIMDDTTTGIDIVDDSETSSAYWYASTAARTGDNTGTAIFRETEQLHNKESSFDYNLWDLLTSDGVFIRMTDAGKTIDDWKYGDEVWRITVDPNSVIGAVPGDPGDPIPPTTQNGGTTPNGINPGGVNDDGIPGPVPGGEEVPDPMALHGAADEVNPFTLTRTGGDPGAVAPFAEGDPEGTEYSVVPLSLTNGLVIQRAAWDGSVYTVADDAELLGVNDSALFTLKYTKTESTPFIPSTPSGGGNPTPSKSATDPKDLNDRPNGLNWWDHYAYIQGYADDTFRPNQTVTRAQAAVMLYRLLTPERLAQIETTRHSFTDVPSGAWYETAAATMANGGYLSGYADGTFRPNQPITRAQFVTILARFLPPRNADCAFNDVPRSFWAYQAIADTTDAGWISGYADGSFRPNQTITRAQVTAILNRALNRGVDKSSTLLSFNNFPDNPATAWHYYEVIEAANGHDYTGQRPSEHWTALR